MTRSTDILTHRRLWPRTLIALGLCGWVFMVTLPGCTADEDKNYAERARAAADRQLDTGCIDECRHQTMGAPTPEPVDCLAAEEGLEFYPLAIWDFDGGVASNMYSYDDSTTQFMAPNGWEPETAPAQRCIGGDRSDEALHLRGGPFIEWGGGIGRDMKCLNYSPIRGTIKLDELGVPKEQASSYGETYSSSQSCSGESDNSCPPGFVCAEGSSPGRFSCLKPACEDDDDCQHPGWFCDEAAGRCEYYVPDESCGEAPRLKLPDLELTNIDEGACAPGRNEGLIANLTEEQQESYLAQRELVKSACPQRDRDAIEKGHPWDSGKEEFMLGMTLDLSEWEGISFWARRTVDSQAGIRIAVGDKYTDDDLSYLQYHINPNDELHCKRNRECVTAIGTQRQCHDGRPCIRARYADYDTEPSIQNPQECDAGALVDGRCPEARFCFDPDNDLLPPNWSCERDENDEWLCTQSVADDTLPEPWHQRCIEPVTNDEDYDRLCPWGGCIFENECDEKHPCSTYNFADPEDPESIPERFCWNPLRDIVPYDKTLDFVACSDFACDQFYKPFQRNDALSWGKSCHDYHFTGSIVHSYCYEPGVDPDPAESPDLCGDHWLKPVYLSTEWQFYKVPFAQLLQQGWAQEAHQFDLTSIAVVRFTWDRGWVDYWIDDVRFYRHKKN